MQTDCLGTAEPAQAGSLPARILDQAIAWAVKMGSDSVDDADRAACKAWRAAHPRHEQAWRQLQSLE